MHIGMPEFVDNPENRCPVMLVLDGSASMRGEAIAELNAGVRAFQQQIMMDETASMRVELAITRFGGDAELVQDFTTLDGFDSAHGGPLAPPTLEAWGDTPLGAGLELGLSALEARKSVYRRHGIHYYRPWLFLITDGAPTDGALWQHAAMNAQEADLTKRLCFFVVGVDGADQDILADIASPNRPPMMLRGLRFRSLFQWLSTSMRRVSVSRVGAETVALPPVDGWAAVPA